MTTKTKDRLRPLTVELALFVTRDAAAPLQAFSYDHDHRNALAEYVRQRPDGRREHGYVRVFHVRPEAISGVTSADSGPTVVIINGMMHESPMSAREVKGLMADG